MFCFWYFEKKVRFCLNSNVLVLSLKPDFDWLRVVPLRNFRGAGAGTSQEFTILVKHNLNKIGQGLPTCLQLFTWRPNFVVSEHSHDIKEFCQSWNLAAAALGSFHVCDYQHGPTADDYIAWSSSSISQPSLVSALLVNGIPWCIAQAHKHAHLDTKTLKWFVGNWIPSCVCV